MRSIIILFSIISTTLCFSSNNSINIHIADNVYLVLYKSDFNPIEHNIEKCTILGWEGICKIDGKQIYGTDWSMPKSKLDSAFVIIEDKKIPLDVSCMYNPWFGKIKEKLFSIRQCEGGFILKGVFSDGAGSYTTEWRIIKNTSIRTLISNMGC